MRKPFLALALAASALAVTPYALAAGGDSTTTAAQPAIPAAPAPCDQRCQDSQARAKLRRETPREPIPTYITMCESHGYLRALNPSGAGGRYQIMPSTWTANLPSAEWVRIAEQLTPAQARRRRHHGRPLDAGPQWSSRLLQDKVAATIYASEGSAPWSCA